MALFNKRLGAQRIEDYQNTSSCLQAPPTIPDISEEDIPNLQQIWHMAMDQQQIIPEEERAVPSPSKKRKIGPHDQMGAANMPVLALQNRSKQTSEAKWSETAAPYELGIFAHRGIRIDRSPDCRVHSVDELIQPYEQAVAADHQANALTREDEQEDNTTVDKMISYLNSYDAKESEWRLDFLFAEIFLQNRHLAPVLEGMNAVVRRLQFTILLTVQHDSKSFSAYPPITSHLDLRQTEEPERGNLPITMPHLTVDAAYLVLDKTLFRDMKYFLNLPGYRFRSVENAMLPYMLIENKKKEASTIETEERYAESYLTFIAACILHQRLKLRHLGKLPTHLPCEHMVVHCFVVAGSKMSYIQVKLRVGKRSHELSVQELDSLPSKNYIRYEARLLWKFDLSELPIRNHARRLIRHLHDWGHGPHHAEQKKEFRKAHEVVLRDMRRGVSTTTLDEVMQKEAAFHAVPCNDGPQTRSAGRAEAKEWEVKLVMVDSKESLTDVEIDALARDRHKMQALSESQLGLEP